MYAFLRQTLLGLDILHQHNLVHLDIKVRRYDTIFVFMILKDTAMLLWGLLNGACGTLCGKGFVYAAVFSAVTLRDIRFPIVFSFLSFFVFSLPCLLFPFLYLVFFSNLLASFVRMRSNGYYVQYIRDILSWVVGGIVGFSRRE